MLKQTPPTRPKKDNHQHRNQILNKVQRQSPLGQTPMNSPMVGLKRGWFVLEDFVLCFLVLDGSIVSADVDHGLSMLTDM